MWRILNRWSRPLSTGSILGYHYGCVAWAFFWVCGSLVTFHHPPLPPSFLSFSTIWNLIKPTVHAYSSIINLITWKRQHTRIKRKAKQQHTTVNRQRRQVFHAVCPRQRSHWQGQRRTEMSVRVQRSALLAPPWLTVELPSASTAGCMHAHTQLNTKNKDALTLHARTAT